LTIRRADATAGASFIFVIAAMHARASISADKRAKESNAMPNERQYDA